MKSIKETIVVEGKDDESAVRSSVDANIICTHGYGISEDTLKLIKKAYETTGIIIFTDPDHAGLSIRKKLSSLYPNAKHAYLCADQAEKAGDIGVENARFEDIEKAILAAGTQCETVGEITMDDMYDLGLAGLENSAENRKTVGSKLGIGYANAKTFLKRLNYLGIKLEDIEQMIKTGT